jgi:signal transduction histidine kinase
MELRTDSAKPSWRANRLDIALFVASMVALIILVKVLMGIIPEAFQQHYNLYSLISLGGLFLNLTLLVILLRRTKRSDSVQWFAFFIVFGILWSAAEALERSAVTPVGAAYWADIISGVTTFMPAYFYLFVRSYTNKKKTPFAVWVPVVVIGTAAIMGALLAGNNVFPVSDVADIKPWGYTGGNSAGSLVFIAWSAVLAVAAIARLIAFLRRSVARNDRRLATIFIVSAVLLVLTSAVTEVLLPVLGVASIPPLGVFSNALLAVGVIFGIYKYGTLTLSPSDIASTVLENMAGGVVVTDRRYTVLYCNQVAAELLSADGKDFTGRDLRAMAFHRLGESHYEWENQLKEYPVVEIPDFEIEKGDELLILDLKITNLRTDQLGYVFVMNDVSDRKRSEDNLAAQAKALEASNAALQDSQTAMLNLLEDARELEEALKIEKAGVEHEVQVQTMAVKSEHARLEAALNGLDIGVFMLDTNLKLVYANRATENLYKTISKQSWSPTEYLKAIKRQPNFLEDIEEIRKHHLPIERLAVPVIDHIVHTYKAPVLDPTNPHGEVLAFVISAQDVTDAKALERSRDEFFSIASHELRTPLTAIRGNTSMIQDYYGDQLKDPSLKEMIGDIHDSSIRLITIVNDFLNTSRLEQGKIEFKIEPFEPGDLVSEVIAEFKAGDAGAKVPIEAKLTVVPNVLADRDRLKEVLINLIGNAVKFTDTGVITVSLTMDGKRVKLSVTDTGKGIPLESQGLLFRKFQQASNNILTRDSTRSTGLGLYISKLIMVGMGCEIFLDSSVADKGSTFSVLLPAAKPAKPIKPKTATKKVRP